MDKLIYIGKSNKKFTNGRIYKYLHLSFCSTKFSLSIEVSTNKNGIELYTNEYFDFFYKNFKFINEQEYNKMIRNQKLKKINNVIKYN